MANIFWLYVFAVHSGATQRIQLDSQCAAVMQPYVRLLCLLVVSYCTHVRKSYVLNSYLITYAVSVCSLLTCVRWNSVHVYKDAQCCSVCATESDLCCRLRNSLLL